MKLNELYSLISESTLVDDSQLLSKLSTFHRRVRAAFTKVYRLHLNGELFPKAVYKQKLSAAWANATQLKTTYLDFLETHKHALLMSTTATNKIKEFKERNPYIFSGK